MYLCRTRPDIEFVISLYDATKSSNPIYFDYLDLIHVVKYLYHTNGMRKCKHFLMMIAYIKEAILRRSSVSRATKSRVKSKGSIIRQLQRIMLGITHRIYESRERVTNTHVATHTHIYVYLRVYIVIYMYITIY
jgi:hypothetical protein